MGQPIRPGQHFSAPGYRVERDGTRSVYKGNQTPEIAVASYDVSAGDDGSVGTHGLDVHIPDNAVITRVWWDVVTTFTDGADDSATIALGLETQDTDAFKTATAISATGDVWDAGQHAGIPGYPAYGADAAHDTAAEVAALHAATFVKTTAERELVAVVADDDLTAGKLNLFVEYFISD